MANVAAAKVNSNPAYDVPLRKARGVDEIRVTPDIAQHWLTFNTLNRNIVESKLAQFKNDMEAGNWLDDGATVRFAYGKLLDGQHRLNAIVLAGVTLRMTVVHGLDSESQVTMDTGRGRTPRDVLSIEGLDVWESGTLGSAIHTIIAYESGGLLYTSKKYTNREVRNFYLEHRAALDSSLYAVKPLPRKHTVIPLSVALAAHYVFSKVDKPLADRFVPSLLTGEGLARSTPLHFLRDLLLSDLLDKRSRSTFMTWFMMVKAWNATRSRASWKSKSALYQHKDESFPEVK